MILELLAAEILLIPRLKSLKKQLLPLSFYGAFIECPIHRTF